MRGAYTAVLIGLSLYAAILAGCKEDSVSTYSGPTQEGITELYLADCDPFDDSRPSLETVTLVSDPADACNQVVEFPLGESATWTSNTFTIASGRIIENLHLVWHRSIEQASVLTTISVDYAGLATQFSQEISFPIGETVSIVDLADTSEFVTSGDSSLVAVLHIQMLGGTASLNCNSGAGSYVSVGVNPALLCNFEVDLGLNGGVGVPNQAANFAYRHAESEIESNIFLDFTRGAQLSGTQFVFGPQYGLAYLVASSGVCRDTARFIAPVPTSGYFCDTLTHDATYGNLLSDGVHVWEWRSSGSDIILQYLNEVEIVRKTIYGELSWGSAYFDSELNRFLIICRNSDTADTAWGYTAAGVLDTTIIAAAIPYGFLYKHSWIHDPTQTRFSAEAVSFPFDGGSSLILGPFPRELVEVFGGNVGISQPGALGYYNDWQVHFFDSDFNWISRYPVSIPGDDPQVFNVELIAADDHYVVYRCHGYSSVGTILEVRCLRSQL